MPLFTIETTYDLPVYVQRTYHAPDVATACQMAIDEENWESAKKDYDSCGPTRVTGIWKGRDAAYSGPVVSIPEEFFGVNPFLADKLLSVVVAAIDAWPQFDADEEVSGADLVDWFAQWRTSAMAAAGRSAGSVS
ncbi:MAG: hypothetical protein M9924_22110 [Rhizobiaceae bacterium]|nr:hypothetical protein [Rhizobiaceae bacterium]